MLFVEFLSDNLIIERALYPINLIFFALTCSFFTIVLGLYCNTELCERRWKHIDLPYYFLGTFGVILLFYSSMDNFSQRALEENVSATKGFLHKISYTDPSDKVPLENIIIEQSAQIIEIEKLITVGCNQYGVSRLCDIKNDKKISKEYWGSFVKRANILKTHKEVCNLKERYVNAYRGPIIDSKECWRFDDGSMDRIFLEKDTNYYYYFDSILRQCKGRKGDISYNEYYNPGQPLTILNDREKEDPNNFCSNLNEFEVNSRYIETHSKINQNELDEAISRVITERKKFLLLESGAFQALWPYMLILGFSLKLGKWASSIRKRRGELSESSPPQTQPKPPSPTT